jgi:hypothetical protein
LAPLRACRMRRFIPFTRRRNGPEHVTEHERPAALLASAGGSCIGSEFGLKERLVAGFESGKNWPQGRNCQIK